MDQLETLCWLNQYVGSKEIHKW